MGWRSLAGVVSGCRTRSLSDVTSSPSPLHPTLYRGIVGDMTSTSDITGPLTRTITIYCDPLVPGLAWSEDEEDYVASGPYHWGTEIDLGGEYTDEELADAQDEARETLSDLWAELMQDGILDLEWIDRTSIRVTGPVDEIAMMIK